MPRSGPISTCPSQAHGWRVEGKGCSAQSLSAGRALGAEGTEAHVYGLLIGRQELRLSWPSLPFGNLSKKPCKEASGKLPSCF